jgi:hypothetical protein
MVVAYAAESMDGGEVKGCGAEGVYILILGSLLGDAGPPPCCSYFCSPPSPAGPSPTSPSLSIGSCSVGNSAAPRFTMPMGEIQPVSCPLRIPAGTNATWLFPVLDVSALALQLSPSPRLERRYTSTSIHTYIGSSSSHQWEFVASSQSCGHYPCRRHRASGTPTSVQLYSSCARQTNIGVG